MNGHRIPIARRTLAATCVLLAVPAAASAIWTPATELGVTDDCCGDFTVAINPAGAALVGWTQHRVGSGGGPGAAQFAFRPAEGAFGPATNPDPLAPPFTGPPTADFPGRTSTTAALASIAASGEATALWRRATEGVVEASSTTTGAFAAPEPAGTGVTSDMRMDRNVVGDIAVVTAGGLLLTRAQSASTWTTSSFGGGPVREANVAVDSKGVALIGWIDTSRRVNVRRFDTRTARFTSPTRLVASDRALSDVGLGADARGRGVIVWRRMIGGREVIRATFLNPDGTRRAPGVQSVSPLNRRAGQFDVAMAVNGNATIAYTRRDSVIATTAEGPALVSRRSPIGRSWTRPAPIAAGAAGIALGSPRVAMAKTITYVAWLSPGGLGPAGERVDRLRVARRVGTGRWARAILDASVDERHAVPPKVHARGSWAIVGWRGGAGLCCSTIQTRIWDPTP